MPSGRTFVFASAQEQLSTRVNRVSQVTADFWLIKLMAVTMGETAADYLAVNLGYGLAATSLAMSAVLIVALMVQFSQQRYVPWAYWTAVVMISVVGTLITDNLVDNFGVRLETTTVLFSAALAATFAFWFWQEGTLSIHTIFTVRREAFYWLAILFTFALGTAAGDLVAEVFDMGYLTTGLLFGAVIALVAFAYYVFGLIALSLFGSLIYSRGLSAFFWRSPVATDRIWRAGLRHDHDQPAVPRHYRRHRPLYDDQSARRNQFGRSASRRVSQRRSER